jgi:hypothetical protein
MYMQTVTRHSSSKDSTRLSFQMPSATSANRPDEVGPGDVEATLPGAVGVTAPHDNADDRKGMAVTKPTWVSLKLSESPLTMVGVKNASE